MAKKKKDNPMLPPEGGAPVALQASGHPERHKSEDPNAGQLRLTAEQFVRAKGLREERWAGFLEECRTKNPGERHTVLSWDVIYRRYLNRPVK